MDYDLILAVIFVFYLRMVTNSMWMYRTSMGLFKEVQYISLLSALLNIILSIILGKICGIAGIIIATAISRLLTTFWYEGKVLYKRFKVGVSKYFYRQAKDFSLLVVSLVISFFLCKYINNISNNHLILFLIKNVLCVVITSILVFIVYKRSDDYIMIKTRLKNILKK
jgi:O-antigen/teichoic acid export membrane protein